MIGAPIIMARAPRAPHPRSRDALTGAAATPAPAPDATSAAEQQTLAATHQQFDLDLDERAELEREREAMESLMLAQLKDEDEVVKKWIAMI